MTIDLSVVRLDLDRKWSACQWVKQCARIATVCEVVNLYVASVEVRETRKGFHVTLRLREPLASLVELPAVQAAMGSDYVRESLNLTRARVGRTDGWNLLFETKGERTTKLRLDYGGMLVQALRRVGQKPRLDAPRPIDWEPVASKNGRVRAESRPT